MACIAGSEGPMVSVAASRLTTDSAPGKSYHLYIEVSRLISYRVPIYWVRRSGRADPKQHG